MKPNFFIIGAPKTGTSSLAQYLSEHEKVFFSRIKEPFFWCDDFNTAGHEFGVETLQKYLMLFAEAEEQHIAIGEGSTRYLRSKNAVKNILAFNPDSKFIVMLRNPVEVVQAYHMEQKYSLHEDVENFEEAWRLQDKRKSGHCIPLSCSEPLFLQYGHVCKFSDQLKVVYKCASPDKVKVLIFDDFKKDTLSVYKEVLSFLNLNYDGREEFPVVNSAHKHRFKFLAKLILSPPKILLSPVRVLRGWLIKNRFPVVEAIKKRLNTKVRREVISKELRSELNEYFREDVTELSKMLKRDLTHWLK
jgi:hypothetical protein